jgi:Flp pilus assembly pilin Flp
MHRLMTLVHSFRRNDEGQDLLEYALLFALIAIVAVGDVTAEGQTVNGIFTNIANAI